MALEKCFQSFARIDGCGCFKLGLAEAKQVMKLRITAGEALWRGFELYTSLTVAIEQIGESLEMLSPDTLLNVALQLALRMSVAPIAGSAQFLGKDCPTTLVLLDFQ